MSSNNDSLLDTIEGLVKGAIGRKAIKTIRGNDGSSLVGLSQPTRVEPVTLVDSRLESVSYLGDILSCLNNQFAGYYLMGASALANIEKINVIRTLDSLNPKRDAWHHLVNVWNNHASLQVQTDGTPSTESFAKNLPAYNLKLPVAKTNVGNTLTMESSVGEIDKLVRESPNLCVGRMLEIKFSSGAGENKTEFTVPVNVKLLTTIVNNSIMRDLIVSGLEDNSARGRWEKFKLGEISFWTDLVLCRDLIKQHKRLLASDKDGVISEIYARERGNAATELVSNTSSFAMISNILVIDESTRKEVEYRYGKSLNDFNAREALIEKSNFMIICIVDRDNDKITFYSHTIKAPQVLDVRELKAKGSKNGPDIAEILKAYQAGSSPSF